MYFCILIMPFLSFLSCICFGRFIGIFGSCLLSTIAIATSFFLSLFALYETAILGTTCTLNLGTWMNTELLIKNWLYFDPLLTVMLTVVTGVSSLVHLYWAEYMNGDHQGRFMSYLSLFTGFMLLLVTADNLS